MAGKQIDFPPMQKEDSRVAPFMIGLCVVSLAASASARFKRSAIVALSSSPARGSRQQVTWRWNP